MASNKVTQRLFAVFACTFLIFGTLTNLLTCIVCLRRNMRKFPIYIFIAFMVVADTLALYGSNLDAYFYNIFFTGYLADGNWFYCKIRYFIHFFPLKTSAWILVSLYLKRNN